MVGLIILFSIYLAEDKDLTKNTLQGIAIFLAFNKDFIFRRFYTPPILSIINNPMRHENKTTAHIRVRARINYNEFNEIGEFSFGYEKIIIEKLYIDGNESKISNKVILNKNNPSVNLDFHIRSSNGYLPPIFILEYMCDGKNKRKPIFTYDWKQKIVR